MLVESRNASASIDLVGACHMPTFTLPVTHSISPFISIGHDHICQRCRMLNLTCVFGSDEDTAVLLSLDRDPDHKQGSRSSSLGRRDSLASELQSEQAYHDLSARVVALEAAVAALQTREGLPSLYYSQFSSQASSTSTSTRFDMSSASEGYDDLSPSRSSPAVDRSQWSDGGSTIPPPPPQQSRWMPEYTPEDTPNLDPLLGGCISPELSGELFQMWV